MTMNRDKGQSVTPIDVDVSVHDEPLASFSFQTAQETVRAANTEALNEIVDFVSMRAPRSFEAVADAQRAEALEVYQTFHRAPVANAALEYAFSRIDLTQPMHTQPASAAFGSIYNVSMSGVEFEDRGFQQDDRALDMIASMVRNQIVPNVRAEIGERLQTDSINPGVAREQGVLRALNSFGLAA